MGTKRKYFSLSLLYFDGSSIPLVKKVKVLADSQVLLCKVGSYALCWMEAIRNARGQGDASVHRVISATRGQGNLNTL